MPSIEIGDLRVCEPVRTEFLRSAINSRHRDELEEDLHDMCRAVSVPKDAWRWVETTQYRPTQSSQHQGADPVDLLLSATAVHHDLTVLYTDSHIPTIAAGARELRVRDIRA